MLGNLLEVTFGYVAMGGNEDPNIANLKVLLCLHTQSNHSRSKKYKEPTSKRTGDNYIK